MTTWETIARLRQLLAEAGDYRTLGSTEVGRREAAVLHAIIALPALPALLDVAEAARALADLQVVKPRVPALAAHLGLWHEADAALDTALRKLDGGP